MTEEMEQLPTLPIEALNRKFYLYDINIEITSLDISSNGAHLVAGSSNGMVLLFDLSNPYSQNGGMLIGQIRAKGMHTSLLMTVRFSQDSRFCFVGVTKGSSEMLAIDLGKLLVDWDFYQTSLNLKDLSKNSMESINSSSSYDPIQVQYLQNCVTFSHSDAKLRGFDAVVPMYQHHRASYNNLPPTNLYRLACGKGIKNFHIWNFEVINMQEAKWDCIYDVGTNGNTITHLEFRNFGKELLTKSAGMNIRLWDINSSDAIIATHKMNFQSSSEGHNRTTTTVASTSTTKPNYTDIANSQDAKCLLTSGTFAYGGTYEFSLINTTAPKEANRDVLELPERMVVSSSSSTTSATNNTLLMSSGRKLTREIQQVLSTPEGKHALIICADGGVIYYQYQSSSNKNSVEKLTMTNNTTTEDPDMYTTATNSTASAATTTTTTSCTSSLIELPSLHRIKEEQQFASWILKRVGSEGHVILLRATNLSNDQRVFPATAASALATSISTVIEVRFLASYCPPLFDSDSGVVITNMQPSLPNTNTCSLLEWHDTGMYYINTYMHTSQQNVRKEELVRIENKQLNQVNRKTKQNNNKLYQDEIPGKATAVKRVQMPSDISSTKRKYRDESFSDNKSPSGANLITPAVTIASTSKHNKISPQEYELAARLSQSAASPPITISRGADDDEGTNHHDNRNSSTSMYTSVTKKKTAQSTRSHGASKSCSFAKLKALRDDDDDDDKEDNNNKFPKHIDTAVLPPLLNIKAPPKVLRKTLLSNIGHDDDRLIVSITPRSQSLLVGISPQDTPYDIIDNKSINISNKLSYLMTTCELIMKAWMKSTQHTHKVVNDDSYQSCYFNFNNIVIINRNSSNRSLSAHTMQKIGHIIMEQERMKVLFALEVYRYLQKYLKTLYNMFLQNQWNKIEEFQIYHIIHKYQLLAKEITDRQLLEIKGTLMMDCGATDTTTTSLVKEYIDEPGLAQIHFAYNDFFQSALIKQDEIKTIIQKELNI